MLLLGVQKLIGNFFLSFSQQIKYQGEMMTGGQADREVAAQVAPETASKEKGLRLRRSHWGLRTLLCYSN